MKLTIKSLLLSFIIILPACSVFESQTEEREIEQFSALEVSGLVEVFITQSNGQKLRVEVSGIPITDVITIVENGTLMITTRGIHRGESVQVYLNYQKLERIKTSGSAELTGTNTLNANQLLVTTSGSGDIKELSIKANTLSVSINGAGNADLDVDVQKLNIEMNDAGDLSIKGIAKEQNIRSNSSRGSLNNARLSN